MLFARDVVYGTAIIAALGIVYTSLGVLNGRLAGGFTLHNLPWAICVGVFAFASAIGLVLKVILLVRRRHQKPFRSQPGRAGWIQDPPD